MPSSPLVLILMGVGLLLIMGCLAGAFTVLRRKRVIDDLPTSKTQGVFIGLTELKGTAESEHPFIGYLSGVKCVYYNWRVEEEWRRTVTQTHTDSKGHVTTSTRTESGWKQVAAGGEKAPFYLKDDSGLIQVVPDGAKVTDNSVFSRTVTPADALYYSDGPQMTIANSTYHRRFSERALPLHAMLYVLGQARERQDTVAAEIAQDKKRETFIISTKTEKQISRGYAGWFWMWTVFGILIAVGTGIGWMYNAVNGSLNWQPPVILGLAYLLAFLLIYLWTTYNNLVNLHHRVEQGWSQLDVQIKRRFDLIPNLVKAVESFRQYEQATQTTLANMRRQLEATPAGVAGPDYQGLNISLRVLIENYPDLKASENFLKLQNGLEDCEQRIALARDYFNQIATFYNTRLEIVPERFVAVLAGMKPRQLMGAAQFERAAVKVVLAE